MKHHETGESFLVEVAETVFFLKQQKKLEDFNASSNGQRTMRVDATLDDD